MVRLFRVFVPVGALTLLISEILLITTSVVVATYVVLEVDPTDYLLYDRGLMRIIVVLVSILIGLHFQDLYSQLHLKSRIALATQLCMAMGVALLLQSTVSYVNRDL